MGPRAGLDGRKISSPPGFDPRPSARSQSLFSSSNSKELLTGTQNNCEYWIKNTETASHPWTISSSGSCRYIICFQETGRVERCSLEETYIVKVMEAMEYVHSIKDPVTPIVKALTQHNPDNVTAS